MKSTSLFSFIVLFFFILLFSQSCSSPEASDLLTEKGISRELAIYRKKNYNDPGYNLFFSIPEKKADPVQGWVTIEISLKEKKSVILDFRGEEEQVLSVFVNGESVPYIFRNEHIIIGKRDVVKGKNEITISFIPEDQSLNRRDAFLYTLLVPERARTLFPCFDQPDMKSLYSLSLEIPENWEAVSNGPLMTTESANNRKRIRFQQTEPLSTYLFSFVAGELKRETFIRNEQQIAILHRETDSLKIAQCEEIASEIFDSLEWLEEYTGVPYPFAKYDAIILPGFQYGGMEHTGATLYTARRMFLSEHPTLNERMSRSALIAHETAHMWFGDYVTMEWFDDVWTKEVFANYFAARMIEPLYPEVNHPLNFIVSYTPPTYAEDRTPGSTSIKQPLDNLRNAGLVYGNIIYNKSPIVLEMMIRFLGEEAYRKGIHEYLVTYSYGNADWNGLIEILDRHTEKDLESWSRVWIEEKGMPHITYRTEGDELIVKQTDPFNRGMLWPQTIQFSLINGQQREDILIEANGEKDEYRIRPEGLHENSFLIPNTDGRAYGYFRFREKDIPESLNYLLQAEDDVIKGSLLINLYENLLHHQIDPGLFAEGFTRYLTHEQNPLLVSTASGYLSSCFRLFPLNTRETEEKLWQYIQTNIAASLKLQMFRLYQTIASSEKGIQELYRIWEQMQPPAHCALNENDYTQLAYKLALYMPDRSETILNKQQERIKNPDQKQEFEFIRPALSPDAAIRDSVFHSLLLAENRRVEPWASTTLAWLNHPLRQKGSVKYIRSGLEILQEIQRTGDIFFPTAWLRSLLGGHLSQEAKEEVETFLQINPDYPPMLKNKILQQSDHLFRFY